MKAISDEDHAKLIANLDLAEKGVARLRASHADLLAAAKAVIVHCDAFEGHIERDQQDALEAAIAAAEELEA